MGNLTLTQPSDESLMRGRSAAWAHLQTLDPHTADWESRLSAVTMMIVDCVVAADTQSLQEIADPLRMRLAGLNGAQDPAAMEMAGWLKGCLATMRWALEKVPSDDEMALHEQGQAWRFLDALSGEAVLSSSALRQQIDTGESQVSRVGRDLRARGLVAQRRAGRTALWEITPRGRQVISKLRADRNHGAHVTRGLAQTNRRGVDGQAASAPPHTEQTSQTDARERFVQPHKDGGWMVSASLGGRAITRAKTKEEAMSRARKILANAGGGQLVATDRNGNPGNPANVSRRGAA